MARSTATEEPLSGEEKGASEVTVVTQHHHYSGCRKAGDLGLEESSVARKLL